MINISKSHPPPHHGNSKYRWDRMKVGDSFFAPRVKLRSFRTVASRAAKKHGIKLSVCAEASGARCRRTA